MNAANTNMIIAGIALSNAVPVPSIAGGWLPDEVFLAINNNSIWDLTSIMNQRLNCPRK